MFTPRHRPAYPPAPFLGQCFQGLIATLWQVLLSYYFGFNKKKQFVYLRRFASDQVRDKTGRNHDSSSCDPGVPNV